MQGETVSLRWRSVPALLGPLRTPLLVWGPVAAILAAAFAVLERDRALFLPAYVAIGFFLWTFLEYHFHRFVLHIVPWGRLRRYVSARHLLHHRNATNHPGIVLLWVSALNGSMLALTLALAFGPAAAAALMAGVITGYLGYEIIHLLSHVEGTALPPLLDRLRTHHLAHHRQSARSNFAITVPLWDRAFGTTLKPR